VAEFLSYLDEKYQELIAIQQQQIDRLIEEVDRLKRDAVAPNKYERFWNNLKDYIAKLNKRFNLFL
jgi:hypothetical protein